MLYSFASGYQTKKVFLIVYLRKQNGNTLAVAGTRTPFHTGNTLTEPLLKNAGALRQGNETVLLSVGETPANDWGVYDMHGNVEEWCYDWYGLYQPEMEVDPAGRKEGDFKVTRGGSPSTGVKTPENTINYRPMFLPNVMRRLKI